MSYRTPEEHRWLLALENATFGVWDLDPRLETVHYSPQWKARLGFPRIHAPDSTAFWRCRVHPDDLEPMLGSLRSHLDGHSSSYEMQFRLRSNGSGYRTVLSRGRAVARDEHGQATRMIGTTVDLTGSPATAALYGLASEDPGLATEAAGLPLHAALGVMRMPARTGGPASENPAAGRSATSNEHRLFELIDDLLDIALREGSAVR